MTSNSYGFDFLKSEHVLPHNNNDHYASYDTTTSNGVIVSQQSSTQEDETTNNNNGSLQMDEESFRHREMLAMNKPALEKQYDILAFLQKHTRGSSSSNTANDGSSSPSHSQQHHHTKCLPPNIIYRATGIDIQSDTTVHTMLQNNPKIIIEYIPDPENPTLLIPHYGYQAKYPNVMDRLSLISQINRTNQGIPMIRDLYDCYTGIEKDIASSICSGDIIAIANNDDRDKILFPRGDLFLTELDGIITIPSSSTSSSESNRMNGGGGGDGHDPLLNGNGALDKHTMNREIYIVDTDVDPRKQIRRGEAIQVGGQWFRLSSAIKAGVPLSEQPVRAQAPLSVVSHTELSSRNEVDGYIRPFTTQKVPLDDRLSDVARKNILAAKTARESLTKLAHSIGGGGASGGGLTGSAGRHSSNSHSTIGIIHQLTGSYASASNPTTLAASLSSTTTQHHPTSAGLHTRKRPTSTMSSSLSSFQNQPHQQRPTSASIVSTKLALEKAAADPALALYNHARRHGCTKDIRDMYFATRKHVPESDQELNKLLVEYKLLEPNEIMRRPRLMNIKSLSQSISSNLDNDGKPKKRRYYERKNQRMTNTHLEGTEIGALLALAAEKQKQGKSVGDGGM